MAIDKGKELLTPGLLQRVTDAAAKKQTQQLELPIWGDPYRAMPNELVRSALFAVRDKRAARTYVKNHEVAMIGKGKLFYTGEELSQDDETVWMHLVNLARESGINTTVKFTPYSFNKAIGWTTNQAGYKRLRESLDRLKFGGITLVNQRITENGIQISEAGGLSISLLRRFTWQGPDGAPATVYTAELEREAAVLFSGGYFSLINWTERLALPTGLATWLHSFFASHREPIPLKISQIRLACGAATPGPQFKRNLKKAMGELQKVGAISSFEIAGDILTVTRNKA
ncbi:hypothetical protein CEK28_08685 [Xenophilus sp. AP218F]|nr:hypothetical protein CEK28_08685 [Xenophilus sp. AP218F]